MKKRQRKKYSADLKAKIAEEEAVKAQGTIQEIAPHCFLVLQSGAWASGLRLSDPRIRVFSTGDRGLWKLARLWKSPQPSDSHRRLQTASRTRLFHNSPRPGGEPNINPFQRRRSTL